MQERRDKKQLWSLQRLAAVLGIVLAAWGLFAVTHRLELYSASPFPLAATLSYSAVSRLPVFQQREGEALVDGRELSVELPFETGQTINSVLLQAGLDSRTAHAVATELGAFVDLRRIRPADRYALHLGAGGQVAGFSLIVGGEGQATVHRETSGWKGEWEAFQRRVQVRRIEGELKTSLEESVRSSGAPAELTYKMADALQWDIDFNRDLRLGDRFMVLYEEIFLEGTYHAVGRILSLSYENQGRRLDAYRFADRPGFYDAEGRPIRKLFLRSPLRYSRVTSRFSGRRFHPVLKRYRPHYGVDYGAPAGTPVRVTANGVVTFAGWDGGGGNTVKVRHPNDYLTAYLHLSKFARGTRSGRRVVQGDIIGYVGSTGLSTGAHLDYRVQHRGKWTDPLSLRSVPADPIPVSDMAAFTEWREALDRSLRQGVRWQEPEVVENATRLAVAPIPQEDEGQIAGR